jgi:hypothetical protein
MTEAEWLACTNPEPMLECLEGKISDRKLRLFGCACCRRIWDLLEDERSRAAVEAAELFADDLISEERLDEAGYAAEEAFEAALGTQPHAPDAARAASAAAAPSDYEDPSHVAAHEAPHAAAVAAANRRVPSGGMPDWGAARDAERAAQCDLLRDLIGNPFQAVMINPVWLTPQVIALARTIYDERAYDRLPELVDALEDSGCQDADILNHCRGPGDHTRGCWAIDSILGKS